MYSRKIFTFIEQAAQSRWGALSSGRRSCRRHYRYDIRSERRTCNFTLIELLVIIAIISIMAAMLLPALNKAKDKTKEASCGANLKQVYQGLNMYSNDYGNYYPIGYNNLGTLGTNRYWFDLIRVYVNADPGSPPSPRYVNTVYECKMDRDRIIGGNEYTSYIYVSIFFDNYSIATIFTPQIRAPGNTGVITDGWAANAVPSQVCGGIEGGRTSSDRLRPRHSSSANILYCDGHVISTKALISQSLRHIFVAP